MKQAMKQVPEPKPARVVRKTAGDFLCTAEDLVRERDEKGLSWAQVAANLGLGNPSAARKAYSLLVGKPHNESTPAINRSSGGGWRGRRATLSPLWNDESDQGEIETAISSHVVVVSRSYKGIEWQDELPVGTVTAFTFDGKEEDGPLVVHFYEPGNARCSGGYHAVSVNKIVEVR